MGDPAVGNQKIFGKTFTSYKGELLKYLFLNIKPYGIHWREAEPYISGGTEMRIPPCKLFLQDKNDVESCIMVQVQSEIAITPNPGSELVIARFEDTPSTSVNGADFLSVTYIELLDSDVILSVITTSPSLAILFNPAISRFNDEFQALSLLYSHVPPVYNVLNDPPAVPTDGMRVLVGGTPIGVYGGHPYELAVYNSATLAWYFTVLAQPTQFINLDGGGTPALIVAKTTTGYVNAGTMINHGDTIGALIDNFNLITTMTHLSGVSANELLSGAATTIHTHLHATLPDVHVDSFVDSTTHLSGARANDLLGGLATTVHTHLHSGLPGSHLDSVTASATHLSGAALSALNISAARADAAYSINNTHQVVTDQHYHNIFGQPDFPSLGLILPFAAPVEYVSNTPPTAAADDKLYFVSSTPTGDWVGHALEFAKDASGGWVFITSPDPQMFASKENDPNPDNWAVYLTKTGTWIKSSNIAFS